jgi:hypothetical protein
MMQWFGWRHWDTKHISRQLECKHAAPRTVAMFWHYWHFNPQTREKISTWYQPIIARFRVDTVGVATVVYVFDIYISGRRELTASIKPQRRVSNWNEQKVLLPFEVLVLYARVICDFVSIVGLCVHLCRIQFCLAGSANHGAGQYGIWKSCDGKRERDI